MSLLLTNLAMTVDFQDRPHALRPQQKDEKVLFSYVAGIKVEVSEVL